jgi:hypothetical protein
VGQKGAAAKGADCLKKPSVNKAISEEQTQEVNIEKASKAQTLEAFSMLEGNLIIPCNLSIRAAISLIKSPSCDILSLLPLLPFIRRAGGAINSKQINII